MCQGKHGKKQGMNCGKNHKLNSRVYYEYHVIAVSVDPLQKFVRKIRSCSQRKQGKKTRYQLGKIINLRQVHINIILEK